MAFSILIKQVGWYRGVRAKKKSLTFDLRLTLAQAAIASAGAVCFNLNSKIHPFAYLSNDAEPTYPDQRRLPKCPQAFHDYLTYSVRLSYRITALFQQHPN